MQFQLLWISCILDILSTSCKSIRWDMEYLRILAIEILAINLLDRLCKSVSDEDVDHSICTYIIYNISFQNKGRSRKNSSSIFDYMSGVLHNTFRKFIRFSIYHLSASVRINGSLSITIAFFKMHTIWYYYEPVLRHHNSINLNSLNGTTLELCISCSHKTVICALSTSLEGTVVFLILWGAVPKMINWHSTALKSF